MKRSVSVSLAVSVLLILPGSCFAQKELIERIKKVTDVAIWQRVPLDQKDLKKAFQDLQSPDQKTMQDAFERLALCRPIPANADLIVGETQSVAKRTRDKFTTAMAFEIRRDWTEARDAARTLQVAQRSGGIGYLEQIIVRGNAAQAGGPMIAVAYSGNTRAAAILAGSWRKNKIAGMRAFLILGPPAAPELAGQLSDDDEFVQKDVIILLGRIGTEKEIPAMKKLAATTRVFISRQIAESIDKIEARAEEAKKLESASKKKK